MLGGTSPLYLLLTRRSQLDLESIEDVRNKLKFRGAQGEWLAKHFFKTTGFVQRHMLTRHRYHRNTGLVPGDVSRTQLECYLQEGSGTAQHDTNVVVFSQLQRQLLQVR